MNRIKNHARARYKSMKCFAKLVELVESDPDPLAQDKYQEEFNCKNCDDYKYCCKLCDVLS